MFQLLPNRRRTRAFRSQFGGFLRRPLGFEAMEGRWLLSAMSLDATTLSLPTTPLTVQIGQVTFAGGQTPQFNAVSEGGFISLHELRTNAVSGGGLVFSSTDNWVTSPVTAGVNRGNSVGHLDFDSTGSLDRPAIFVPSDPGPIVRPNTDQIAGGQSNSGSGGQEGGLIEIKRILAPQPGELEGDERNTELAKRVPDETAPDQKRHATAEAPALRRDTAADAPWDDMPGSTSVVEVRLDSGSSDRSPSSHRSAISGEWARAVVFEIAGGEPAWARTPTVTIQARPAPAAERAGSPSPAAPLPPGGLGQVIPRAAVRAAISAHEIDLAASVRGQHKIAGAVSSAAPLAEPPQDGALPAIGLSAFNVRDALSTEVFAEFGRTEKALLLTSTDEDPDSITVAALPLLALLVLERVAAHYRSRTDQEASTVVAGPPRR